MTVMVTKIYYPSYSAPAWTSFMTGVNTGKYGIYGFSIKLLKSYKIKYVNRTFNTTYKTVWQLLSGELK